MLNHRVIGIVTVMLLSHAPRSVVGLQADIYCSRANFTESDCDLIVSNGQTAMDMIMSTFDSCATSGETTYDSMFAASASTTSGSISSSTTTATKWNFTRAYPARRNLRQTERMLPICNCCTIQCQLLGVCGGSCGGTCGCRRRLADEDLNEDFLDAMEAPRELAMTVSQSMQNSCSKAARTVAWKLQQAGNWCFGDPTQVSCTVTTFGS